MARRIFEFVCTNSHRTEAFIDSECYATLCKECGAEATRVVSAPSMKLEAFTGSFPTAYSQWNRKHSEKLAIEQKRNA